MAEAPLESWEDLESENEALSSKLSKIGFDGSYEDRKEFDGPSSSDTRMKTNKCNGNGMKILQRPANIQPQSSSTITTKTPINPQITLEDNTRTQYVPQVRILQRPKGPPQGSKNGQDGENKSPSKSNGNNLITKSYQEREAEYAKVRLRILGSAVPDYKESDLVPSAVPSFTSSNTNSNSRQANGDVPSSHQASGSKSSSSSELPVVRFPQGPDGSKGFASRR